MRSRSQESTLVDVLSLRSRAAWAGHRRHRRSAMVIAAAVLLVVASAPTAALAWEHEHESDGLELVLD